jgi:hypothetical protein
MAISRNTKVQRIEVSPPMDAEADNTTNLAHESVMVVYEHVLTGTGVDVALNGGVSTTVKHLYKFVEDGGDATDYSSEDALVQTVCGAIWA